MKSINDILHRPAREQTAFRFKLEQTLAEVDRISCNLAATNLASLNSAAKQFEAALLVLRDRQVLRGNDFLPLAVRLDEFHSQFSLVQSLSRFVDTTANSESASDSDGASGPPISRSDLTAERKFLVQAMHPSYQSTVKNIAIQFIRNAVLHGIESGAERVSLGKPRVGHLTLNFMTLPDGSFEMSFDDDGRGIDPETVRE